jgi:hypothetical protein
MTMKHALIALAALAAAAPALAQDSDAEAPAAGVATMTDVEREVRERVADYFLGGQDGDQERLARAFDLDNGHMKFVTTNDDGEEVIAVVTLADFRARMNRPTPVDRTGRILALDIVDEKMAWVKFQIVYPDGAQFIDYLLMYKRNGDWSIVNKMFVRRAGED